jgi:hypothetical protein
MHLDMPQALRCHAKSKRSDARGRWRGSQGNRNAWKHEQYSAQAIALRREVLALARLARG